MTNPNNDVSLKEYNNTIREMINHENEIRNQRTNWFLVIQGFLIAGLCTLCEKGNYGILSLLISLLGLTVSISFGYVAWRSTKAVTMAIACWKLFLEEKDEKLSDYPPINLITREIISQKISVDDTKIGTAEFNKKIFDKMYEDQTYWIDKKINGLEFLLPYRFLPFVFFLLWIIILFALCYLKGLSNLLIRI